VFQTQFLVPLFSMQAVAVVVITPLAQQTTLAVMEVVALAQSLAAW
jgi:hypothetical protein